MASFLEKLQNYNDAAYPALWIQTYEESRIVAEIVKGMVRSPTQSDTGRKVYEWDSINGLTEKTDGRVKTFKDSDDVVKLFKIIHEECVNQATENIFILKDFHLQFEKPLKRVDYIRAFKNILPYLRARRNLLLFVSPVIKVPTELIKDIQLLDYKLPTEESINSKLNDIFGVVNDSKKAKDKFVLTSEVREAAVEAAKGMTAAEVENAFALAIVENKAFDMAFVKSVFGEKIQQVKKGGMLNHIDTDIAFDSVGGLDGIKAWIKTRKHAFSKEARDYNLPYPKGIGLAGVAGCGKTLISKAIANEFKFPLFQLDLGGLFSKYVGETEGNFIQMVKTVDSIGRCVILIDEIEKYLNSGATSGNGDSGTSSRSFGTLLSWLNDRTNPAFVVFTSNNHLALPPELVRKGRFDDIFWVDLPSVEERKDVFSVVIKKYGRDVKNFDIDELVVNSAEFTGSEIDNAFKAALFAAFAEDKEVSHKHVLKELVDTIPQSRTNSEHISAMRGKVEGLLRPASKNNPKLKSYMEEIRKVKA